VNVSFHPLAEREPNDAAQCYESNGAGLGAAFLTEVQRSWDGIVEYPGAGLVMTGSVRRRLIRRFPYALLYRIREDQVRILAVMNLKRRPGYWVGRT
jgi:plasmid stabilization system protein ParE